MRASRLLSIMLTLSVRDQVAAAELAAELEVSVRTIYRDVEALSAAGVPVYATRGRAGGVRLLPGFRTRLTGLTADDADAMLLSGLPGAAAELGLGGVLAATQLKLLAALPPQLRERAQRSRDRFHLDAPGWLRDGETPPCLAEIADAAWAQRVVDVRYEKADRSVVDRVLQPLGLVLKAGSWYLVANAVGSDAGPRTYRVIRVQAAAAREQTFDRPAGFDLAGFWTHYQRDYEQRVYRESAQIRLSPRGRELLFLLGTAPARRARAGLGEPDGDDWATTTLPIESHQHALHALLQLGEHVEVLGPPQLRELVATAARRTAERYATDRAAT